MNEAEVALITGDIARGLLDLQIRGLRVWVNPSKGDIYVTKEVAEDNLSPTDYTFIMLDEEANYGTYPVKKNRRMFPW